MLFDTSRIIKILDANKIKYNEKFNNLRGLPFPNDECVVFAEELVKKIESIAIYGLNSNLGKVSKLIVKLIDTTVKLGSRSAGKNLIKIKKEINESKEIKSIMAKVNKNTIDVREPLIKALESTKVGVDVLLSRYEKEKEVYPTNVKCLKETKALLEEISNNVNNILDYSSKHALGYANECLQAISDYRFKASENVFTAEAMNHLKEINKKVAQWSTLVNKISLFNPTAKQSEVNQFEKDEFEYTVRSAELFEAMAAFHENMFSYETNLSKRYDTKVLEERNAIQEKEYESSRAKLHEIFKKVRNGEVSQNDYNYEIATLDKLCDKYKKEIKRAKDKINDLKFQKLEASSLYNQMVDIYDRVMMYQDDYLLFGLLSEELDLGGLVSVSRGVLSKEDADKVFASVEKVLAYIQNLRENPVEYDRRFEDMIRRHNEANEAKRQEVYEEEIKEAEKTNIEININDLASKYGMNDIITQPVNTPIEGEKEKQTTEEEQIVERDIADR